MENQIVVQNNSLMFDPQSFEHAQRVGKMLSSSTMVPEHFRGPNNIGNCVIAMEFANRGNLSPTMVMQKMYIIHGKPAIETQLQVALFNSSKRFSRFKYKMTGTGDNQTCVASATDLETKEIVHGPPVSIAMAKKEGWYGKKGSKWQTLPDLMLHYRSASFFIRVHSPESSMGFNMVEEMPDVIDVGPEKTLKDEISKKSNSEPIDITPEPKETKKEPEPENGYPLTDQEKSEIEAEEASMENDGPGY